MNSKEQPIRVVVEFPSTARGLQHASKLQEDIQARLGYDAALVLPQGRDDREETGK